MEQLQVLTRGGYTPADEIFDIADFFRKGRGIWVTFMDGECGYVNSKQWRVASIG